MQSISCVQRIDHGDRLERATHAELLAVVRDLLARVAMLEAENATLKAENAALREELRASKRATAPFSKGKGKARPRRPGRKAGKGLFTNRPEPQPGPTDIVEDIAVPLNSSNCPQCGSALEVNEQTATVEDTPPEPVRVIKRFKVEVGVCPVCGWRGRGSHPNLAAGQHGATAHRVGPQPCGQGFRASLSLRFLMGFFTPVLAVYQVLKSLTATIALRGHRVATAVADMLAGKPMPKVPIR